MRIIACLGNPGRSYSKNRHNAGFIIGKDIADHHCVKINRKFKKSIYGIVKFHGEESLLLFPQTYMNASGSAVREAVDFYRLGISNLVVLHDEIELPFGECRLKTGGGHKGHNGLRSIIQEIGGADFRRVRIGVGRPPDNGISVAEYVLSNFTGDELAALKKISDDIIEGMISIS
jgi:PTH1 family peptidyl-tRNA hydrolase